MPALDTSVYISQLFWLLISFVLLYLLLSKLCIPQLTKVFALREAKINNAVEQAKIAQAEAVQLQEQYEAKLTEAIKEKNIMLAEAIRDIANNIDNQTAELDLHFDKMLKAAEKQLQDFETKSLSNVSNIAKKAAKDILNDFLKIDINDDLVSRKLEEIKKSGEKNAV